MSSHFDSFDVDDLPQPPKVVAPVTCPNQPPSIPPSTYRLAIIGDFPSEDDLYRKTPFSQVYDSKLDLSTILSTLNITRSCCFVGNVTLTHRKKGDTTPPTDKELSTLQCQLAEFKPNLVLLLGRLPFSIAKGTKDLDSWRGSLFICDHPGPFLSYKCLASYHPRDCFRNYEWTPLLSMDFRKAATESRVSTLSLPQRDLITNLSFEQLKHELNQILLTKPTIACDIEGGINTLSCISFAPSPSHSFIVPITNLDGASVWSITEEATLWHLISSIMYDSGITKIWQNGLYDRFVLQYSYNITVRNSQDIMLGWWELYCELKKSLGFQCSILTNEPFYKADRKTTDQETFYRYCCRDSAVTIELFQKIQALLSPAQSQHYAFNNISLNFLLYAELRGIKYNQPLANERLAEVEAKISALQNSLDEEAEKLGAIQRIDYTKPKEEILAEVQTICCHKKDHSKPKKSFEEDGYYDAIFPLVNGGEPLTEEQKGTLSVLCGTIMNMRSHKKFLDFLYDTCGLPTQWKKNAKGEMVRTANYATLLRLSKNNSHPVLTICLQLAKHITRAQMLSIRSLKGRMYCSYNLVGTETGRISCSKSILGSGGKKRVGANLQTVPDDWTEEEDESLLAQGMRDLFLADDGCYIGKADLKGADGWTIGAYMASIGDRTMLDDLLFGIKPAQVVAYILVHGADAYFKIARDRVALHAEVQCIGKEMWQYFVSKIGIWGYFYTMGPRALATNVFVQSEGEHNLSEKQAREFQNCIGLRYNAKKLQDYFQSEINKHPYPFKLACPNGMTRRFFGRKKEILGEVLAHVPQVVTTHATLLAASNLWNDLDNRILVDGRVKLRVELLHQVHDELVMQWKIEDTEFAKKKISQWFKNTIVVAGQKITIPFDGSYGTSWAMDKKSKIGSL